MLWSRAALASKWHKAEFKMARHIELYRHFEFRVIHVFLEDLSDVTDDSFKLILSSRDFIRWSSKAINPRTKRQVFRSAFGENLPKIGWHESRKNME